MATKYDMLTNEGNLALARAVATGAKLSIRGAVLCNVTSGMSTVAEVANLKWSDISSSAIPGAELPCTSYLPSLYEKDGGETGKPVTALDIEFTFMPTEEVTYNVIAVLADLYYMFAPFTLNDPYKVGDTVWYLNNTGDYSYYRCIEDVSSAETMPQNDSTHWESVNVYSELDTQVSENLHYKTIDSEPTLLYISKVAGEIKVGPEVEIDYKVRLYLEGVTNTADDEHYIKEYIVFDTLGPEFMSSTQMNLLAYFAQAMQHIRDVAVERAGRS